MNNPTRSRPTQEVAYNEESPEDWFVKAKEDRIKRIGLLLPHRWKELVAPETPVGRRVRTVSLCGALEEVADIAGFAVESGEEEAGPRPVRGERMLPDVIDEAVRIAGSDRALGQNGGLKEEVLKVFGAAKGQKVTEGVLGHLESLSSYVGSEYVSLSESTMLSEVNSESPSLVRFEIALEQLASHARWLGWSDEGLLQIGASLEAALDDPASAVSSLCKQIAGRETSFPCSVRVNLDESLLELTHMPDKGVELVEMDGGKGLRISVRALDPWAAAKIAGVQVAHIVSSPSVLQKKASGTADGSSVFVRVNDKEVKIDGNETVPQDLHHPHPDQIRKVLTLVAGGDGGVADTLLDAIRFQNRASSSRNVETAFVLLWSALERLCSNPSRPGYILTSTADLISGAMALSKVRREVSLISEALTKEVRERGIEGVPMYRIEDKVVREDKEIVAHEAILGAMLEGDEKCKEFLAPFYENVLLVQWFHRTKVEIAGIGAKPAGPDKLGDTISSLLRNSRMRTNWQVKRLYRARNGLTHGGTRPMFLLDLARHASNFLTNMLGICLNYTESHGMLPRSVLQQRCGWLDTYCGLADSKDPRALSARYLHRPSEMFRSHKR